MVWEFSLGNIYILCNEQEILISDAWDGEDLKLTFRRNFGNSLRSQWYDLMAVVNNLVLTNETDFLVWQLENKGVYSTSSLYHVINFRGVCPMYISAL